jgi:iron complex outermembrane receptor protein
MPIEPRSPREWPRALVKVGLLSPCLLCPAEAPAQEAGADETVIVTARRRPERLLDVPIPMTVMSREDMAKLDAHTLEDLVSMVPAVTFRANASNKDRTVHIRGIGTTTTSTGAEPAVSTVLDGVVLVRGGQQTAEMVDIERLEILRGPQGTLFGKNASAGVILITTADPSHEPLVKLGASLSSDDQQRVSVVTSGPLLSSDVDYRLAGSWSRFDGNVMNLADGTNVNGFERRGMRGKLRYGASTNVDVMIAGDYLHERSSAPFGVYAASTRIPSEEVGLVPNPGLAEVLTSEGVQASRNNMQVAAPAPSDVLDVNSGVALEGKLRTAQHEVTSITAYRIWRNRQAVDIDARSGVYPGLPAIADRGDLRFRQLSQELRVTSTFGGALDYVAGAYYLATSTGETYQRNVTQLLAGGGVQTTTGLARFSLETRHLSAFSEFSLRVLPSLTFNVGTRLIRETILYRHQRHSTAAEDAPGVRAAHESDGRTSAFDVTARGGLQWEIARSASAYVSVSRGYKGPGFNIYFNMGPFDEGPLAPERSISYDVGLKGEAAEGLLDYSLAAFLTRFDNYQTSIAQVIQGTPTSQLVNAGRVSTRGIEADVALHPMPGASVDMSLAWTRARIDEFRCPNGSSDCSVSGLNGQPLPYAPELKLHAGLTYRLPISSRVSAEMASYASYVSRTRYQTYSTPDTIEPSFALLSASIAVRDTSMGTVLRLLASNITGNNYSSYLVGGAGGGLLRMVPRDARARVVLMLTQDL